MPPILSRPIVVLAIAVGTCTSCGCVGPARRRELTAVRGPKKSSSTQDRAFEYMPKAPDFSLTDGNSRTIPNGVGYICLLERSQGDQVLVAIRSQGLRGWAPASSPGSAESCRGVFLPTDPGQPRDAFPYLMRGMARYENDDLEHAFADVDEATSPPQPACSPPALLERAYLWQCRNRLDLALADARPGDPTRLSELDTLTWNAAFSISRPKNMARRFAISTTLSGSAHERAGIAPVQGDDSSRARRGRAGDRRVQYRHSVSISGDLMPTRAWRRFIC